MENVTAKELRNNLDFGVGPGMDSQGSIEEGHSLFENSLQSWLVNRVSFDRKKKGVILTPEGGDAFYMAQEEFEKLCS